MNTKLAFIAAVIAPCALNLQALTWIPFVDANGPKEYAVTDRAYTWHDAEALAQSVGSHLVAINDSTENSWLVSTFGGSELFWMGATDEALEGTWVWTNGDPFSYSNWNFGEPNDATEEEWGLINWGVPGGWNDFESGTDYVNPSQASTSFQNDSFPMRGILERPLGTAVGDAGATGLLLGVSTLGLVVVRNRLRQKHSHRMGLDCRRALEPAQAV